jgi:hypothetical protein
VQSLAQLEALLADLPRDVPYPAAALRARRCKDGRSQQSVALPAGFLQCRDDEIAVEDPLTLDGG